MMGRPSIVSGTYVVGYLILSVVVAFASAVAFIVTYEWKNIFGSSGITLEAAVFVGLFVVMIVAVGGHLRGNVESAGQKFAHLVSRHPVLMSVARAIRFVIDILSVVERHLVELSAETQEVTRRGTDRNSIRSLEDKIATEKWTKSIDEKRAARSSLKNPRKITIRKRSKKPDDF